MKKCLMTLMAISMVAAFIAIPAFAQSDETKAPAKEEQAQNPAAPAPATPAAPSVPAMTIPAPVQTGELSIYGEVQAVNTQTNSMTVQYYDYDNDEEKSIDVTLDSASKLENAKAIGDIKKGDWVDVTYTASAGKNTAKIVSVEKEEPAQEENAPAAAEE